MLTIYDDATLISATNAISDTDLAAIIGRIVYDAKASDLWEMTCIAIVSSAQDVDELASYLGFDPLIGPLAEAGEPLAPYWSHIEPESDGYFELLHCVGDSGFANFILVQDVDGNPLARLCRRHTGTKPLEL